MDAYRIKDRLRDSKHTQAWLIVKLREREVMTTPAQLSTVLNEILVSPKADKILKTADRILYDAGIV